MELTTRLPPRPVADTVAAVPFVIGVVLALVVSLLAWAAGFDRERSFYPTVLVVIASYYILFAAMGASIQVVIAESAALAVFAIVAFLGFKSNLWWVAAALAGHGAFDFVHGFVIQNGGVPPWWPAFCAAYDIAAAACLGLNIRRARTCRSAPISRDRGAS